MGAAMEALQESTLPQVYVCE